MNINKIRSKLKKGYNNLRFRLSAGNSFLFIGYYKILYSPRRGTLDEFLNSYSKSIGNDLTVIQIGANDGINHDPIHKFIKRDNWNGLLLEPQPRVFEKLRKVYALNKGITAVNAALAPENGSGEIYRIAFSDERWANGLTSFNRETLVNSFDRGVVDRKASKEGLKVPEAWEDRIATDKVRLITTRTLLSENNISKIDLLQIDTEGYDFEIIKLFDIRETKPSVIIFESQHFNTETFDECMKHLSDLGYSMRTFGANTLALSEKMIPQYGRYLKS